MSLPEIACQQYSLEVLTEHYLIQCIAEPVGMLMTFLDSPDRGNLLFKRITLTGLGTDSMVSSIKMKELWVQRSEVIAICVDETDLQGAVQNCPHRKNFASFYRALLSREHSRMEKIPV